MRRTRSLPSLLVSLWPGVVALDRGLFMGPIELNCVLMLNWTVYMYKNRFSIDNLQCVIKPNQTKLIYLFWTGIANCLKRCSYSPLVSFEDVLMAEFGQPILWDPSLSSEYGICPQGCSSGQPIFGSVYPVYRTCQDVSISQEWIHFGYAATTWHLVFCINDASYRR